MAFRFDKRVAIVTGAGAAVAVDAGTRPRDLAVRAVQRELLRQGAHPSPAIEIATRPASAAE